MSHKNYSVYYRNKTLPPHHLSPTWYNGNSRGAGTCIFQSQQNPLQTDASCHIHFQKSKDYVLVMK